MSEPLARAEALVIGRRGQPLLPPIDFAFERGAFVAVVGRNGAGKSTFARTLLGLLPPLSGRVALARPDLRLAYVPQVSRLDEVLPMRAREWVALGTLRGLRFAWPWPDREARAQIDAALAAAGARELAASPLRDLSEGQRQRVLLARLLASEPELAVLDEPTAAMDAPGERAAFEQLARLARTRGTAIVVVTHALGAAAHHADRVLLLDREHGAVVSGTPDELQAHPVFRARVEAAEVTHG